MSARAVRYLLVGAGLNGAGYVGYLLLTWGGLTPRLAVTALVPLRLWAAFRSHGRYTFATNSTSTTASLRFIVVSLAGYALNLALLTLLVDWAGIPHPIAQLVSVVLIALANFHLLQRVVFRSSASLAVTTDGVQDPQGP